MKDSEGKRIGRLNQFIDHDDGTVTERRSGLTWKRTAEKSLWAGGITDTFSFSQAINTRDFAGYSNWRLPTIGELKNLLYLDITPAERLRFAETLLDEKAFPMQSNGYFWTSTLGQPSDGRYAGWPVIFKLKTGIIGFGNKKTQEYCVLLVRNTDFFELDVNVSGCGVVTRSHIEKKYAKNSKVTLTASAAEDYVLKGWDGDASGHVNPMIIKMNSAKSITAEFVRREFLTLYVTTKGSGSGRIVPCPDQRNHEKDEIVILNAYSAEDSIFKGWIGEWYEDNGSVVVKMNATKTITAIFEKKPSFALSIIKNGNGSGTVTCSPDAEVYLENSVVKLTAHAADGSKFNG